MKLKPCPFCGCKTIAILQFIGYRIECGYCCATMRRETKKEAVANWNVRTHYTDKPYKEKARKAK